MDLSVVTVTWNNEDQIKRQILSVISGCINISCEEIIIDNGSKDKTVKICERVRATRVGTGRDLSVQDLSFQIITNKNNHGFAAANNQGVEKAAGEFILFLNPDMQVEPGSLDVIVEWMRNNPEVGIVSPKLVDQNGKLNWNATPRRFPKVWEQLALILKLPHLFPKILDKYHMKDFDPDLEQEVDSVRGSFMLMRRALVAKLGWGFDPRYFIWYEDVDICRECKKLGLKVMYTPVITCIDYVGQSFKKRTTLWKQKQFTKSMLIYFKKWEPGYKWIWIWLFRPVGIGMVWVNDQFSKIKETRIQETNKNQ